MITNKKLLVISIALFCTSLLFNTIGQTTNTASNTLNLGLSEVSMIHSSATVNLTLTPQSAGLAVKPSISDSTARVLISSVVSGENTRTMSVAFTGTLPTGTFLNLQAKDPNSNFVGGKGTMGGLATYETSGASIDIISGIGTCYSGTGSDDGYVLKYTYGISAIGEEYGNIRATGGENITATFTLTAVQ